MSVLIEKLRDKTAVIGVVGLGYVGLPLLLRFAEAGYRVLGLDTDINKVNKLNAGESYIGHIPSASLLRQYEKAYEASGDFARAAEADALILCVPTPLNKNREPDLRYVIDAIESLIPHLRDQQIISLESTTYPGTTEEELLPRMQVTGLTVGEQIFLVYSPEREDPGNLDFNTFTIPKVIGGITAACLDVGMALYEQAIEQLVPVTSTRAAEMTKLLENIHRAVNIGLVNEMKVVADKMDIDIHEVITAAATKPFGFTPFCPGPGLGGHCIPVDPFYLTWKAREYGIDTRFIELAGEVNTNMPRWVVYKLVSAMNQKSLAINGSTILVLGIAYKPDVDDLRESPAIEMMRLLRERGADIAYSDPHVPTYDDGSQSMALQSVDLTAETLPSYDCVLLATDHSDFDYDLIRQHARLIVDTRGAYKENFDSLVKA